MGDGIDGFAVAHIPQRRVELQPIPSGSGDNDSGSGLQSPFTEPVLRCPAQFAPSEPQGPAPRSESISIPAEHRLASVTPTHFQNSKSLDMVESMRLNIFACTISVARVHCSDMLTIRQIAGLPKPLDHEPPAFRLHGRGVF